MILVIDNYDSFTYNLVQYLGEVSNRTTTLVFRNDKITPSEIATLAPSHIVISPGPCTPNEAGISLEVVSSFSGKIPLLGVCLGHQAIGQAFGGVITLAKQTVHGKTTTVRHNRKGIFEGIEDNFVATRYHSLVISPTSLPDQLEATAFSPDEEIMAVAHKYHPYTIGFQFHPESILTTVGKSLLARFLQFSYNPIK